MGFSSLGQLLMKSGNSSPSIFPPCMNLKWILNGQYRKLGEWRVNNLRGGPCGTTVDAMFDGEIKRIDDGPVSPCDQQLQKSPTGQLRMGDYTTNWLLKNHARVTVSLIPISTYLSR